MTTLTRESLLAPAKRRYRYVPLPIKGGTARIRSLTQLEREKYEADIVDPKSNRPRSDADRHLLVRCLVDEEGERLFGDDETRLLADNDAGDLALVYAACVEHCGLSLSAIREHLGNSSGDADAGTPSASPRPADDSETSTS
ncbi:MAG: hypothetical protein AAFZ07_20215 [Actinomycetota bacterium]